MALLVMSGTRGLLKESTRTSFVRLLPGTFHVIPGGRCGDALRTWDTPRRYLSLQRATERFGQTNIQNLLVALDDEIAHPTNQRPKVDEQLVLDLWGKRLPKNDPKDLKALIKSVKEVTGNVSPDLFWDVWFRVPQLMKIDSLGKRWVALKEALDFQDLDMFLALKRHPRLISYAPETSKAKYDKIQEHMVGISRLQVHNMIIKCPTVLSRSESAIGMHFELIAKELGCTQEIVAKMTHSSPYIMVISLEKNLLPKLRFLKDECELSTAQIVANPTIFTLSMARMKPRLLILKARKIAATPSIFLIPSQQFVDRYEMTLEEYEKIVLEFRGGVEVPLHRELW